jgi:hypothetical protein
MIIDLLAVVLRKEQAHGTRRNIVCVRNLEDIAGTIVVKDGTLLDSTNPGGTGWRCH